MILIFLIVFVGGIFLGIATLIYDQCIFNPNNGVDDDSEESE